VKHRYIYMSDGEHAMFLEATMINTLRPLVIKLLVLYNRLRSVAIFSCVNSVLFFQILARPHRLNHLTRSQVPQSFPPSGGR